MSNSIATPDNIAPLFGMRRVIRASGAGGSKKLASYAGIGALLDDFFLEINRLFGMRQARAANFSNPRNLSVGHDDIDPGHLWEMNTVGQTHAAIFHYAFVSSTFHTSTSCLELIANLAQRAADVQLLVSCT